MHDENVWDAQPTQEDGSVTLRSYLSQRAEEAKKSYEYHQMMLNDAQKVIDACQAGLQQLENMDALVHPYPEKVSYR